MLTDIDSRLLEKIADLTGKPVGAFNIRKDSGCEARQSTEHIEIVPQPEGVIFSAHCELAERLDGDQSCYVLMVQGTEREHHPVFPFPASSGNTDMIKEHKYEQKI